MGSRGGFGGGRSTGGMMGGQKLPFDVDPTLDDEIAKFQEGENGEQDDPKMLYPPYPGGVPRAPPPTSSEKRLMQIYREMIAKKHAGPFYSGPAGTVARIQTGNKRSAGDFDAFADQPTYGKKFSRSEFRFPDIRKHKFAAPHLFPKELWSTIGYNPDADPESLPRKKLMLAKSNIVDKLAKFDDDAPEGGAGAEEDDDEEVNAEEDDEAEPEGLQDDDFEEDEDDDNNDYNAEQYFDGGEDEVGEDGGDDYGEDGY